MWFSTGALARFLAIAALFEGAFGIGVNVTVDGLGIVIGTQEATSWTNRTLYAFRGIPYAQSPTGDLRFQPPVKIESWNGTIWATDFGNVCPQNPSTGSTVSSNDEDCLTLNIYVPEVDDDVGDLPVMIWIHGGTFTTGYASLFAGNHIVEGNVILVVPQFRLGPLGLLSLQTDEIPGNVQFLDQIMAMQWVQDNIAAFGGNPNEVTIFGQSSGAATVNLHQFSPLSAGLFHRVIMMSGSAFVPWAIDRNPVQTATNLGVFVGCTQTNLTELATCYKGLAVQTLLDGFDAYLATYTFGGILAIGGHRAVIQTAGNQRFLEEEPATLLAEARYSSVPMMGGVTKQDGSFLLATFYSLVLQPSGLANDTSFLAYNLTEVTTNYLGEDDLTGAFAQTLEYAHFDEEDVGGFVAMAPGLVDIWSVMAFKAPVFRMMKANSLLNTTYLYTFSYFGEYSIMDLTMGDFPFSSGVGHSDDLIYLFPGYPISGDDVMVAQRHVNLWTSFARNGVPTDDGVTWDPMTTHVGPYLRIEEETSEKSNFLAEFTISRTEGLEAVTSAAVSLDNRFTLIAASIICTLLRRA